MSWESKIKAWFLFLIAALLISAAMSGQHSPSLILAPALQHILRL